MFSPESGGSVTPLDVFEYLLGGPMTEESLDERNHSMQFSSEEELRSKVEEVRQLFPKVDVYVVSKSRSTQEIAIIMDKGKFLFASVDPYME